GTTTVSRNYATATSLMYAGDFTGDTYGDLISRRANGEVLIHPTTPVGGLKSAIKLATGWGKMTAVFSPGDFDGSGTPDIIAVRPDGSVALVRGNGAGGRGTTSTIATGWNAYHGFG
ncbi:MAG: chitobiase/beta-hexosaminidase C-terminal domain-containing protein, partial [Microbacterium sp.]